MMLTLDLMIERTKKLDKNRCDEMRGREMTNMKIVLWKNRHKFPPRFSLFSFLNCTNGIIFCLTNFFS